MSTPRIIEHYQQSNATDRTIEGNYISISNDDATNDMSFTLTSKKTGSVISTSAITVKAGEVYSNWFERFSLITITNASSCPIKIDVGV